MFLNIQLQERCQMQGISPVGFTWSVFISLDYIGFAEVWKYRYWGLVWRGIGTGAVCLIFVYSVLADIFVLRLVAYIKNEE